jgi:hypothetical protein
MPADIAAGPAALELGFSIGFTPTGHARADWRPSTRRSMSPLLVVSVTATSARLTRDHLTKVELPDDTKVARGSRSPLPTPQALRW